MANYETTLDIIDAALRWSGELTGDDPPSEYRGDALTYLNDLYRKVLAGSNEFELDMGEPWTWARERTPGVLTLKPAVEVNVTLTQLSIDGLFQAVPTESYQGCYLKVGGCADWFLVASHVSGQLNFQLDGPYTGDSVTNQSAKVYFLDYETQPSVLRLLSPMTIYRSQGVAWSYPTNSMGKIMGTDMEVLTAEYPLPALRIFVPDRFAIKHHNDTDFKMLIRMNASVSQYTRVEYDWIRVPDILVDDANSKPLLPLNFRSLLAYGVAYYICSDKNDNRAAAYYAQFQAGLKSMIAAEQKQRTNTNPDRARITPRPSMCVRNRIWWIQ